jgi:hypothetical protein
MINIYTGLKYIPKDKEYVEDNESYFVKYALKGTEYDRKVLDEIDRATYSSADRFKDRLGAEVFISCLSMSSKTLLNLGNYPDIVFNCDEMGENAFEFALCNLVDCNMCFTDGVTYEIPDYISFDDIMFNGKIISNIDELEE